MTHYKGRIKTHVSTHDGNLYLIGDDLVTPIAIVGVGLQGEEFERARADAQRLVNGWNALQDALAAPGAGKEGEK